MKDARSRAEDVIEAALDAIVVIDARGRVTRWNRAAELLLGHTHAEAVGQDLSELIIPPPLREAHRAGLQRYLQTGRSRLVGRRVELPALRRDGEEIPVELSLSRVGAGDPPLFVGHLRGLGDSSLRNESMRLQQRMGFLAQASLVLDGSLDYNETLRNLVELLVPDLAELAVVDLLDRRGRPELSIASSVPPDLAPTLEQIRGRTRLDPGSSHPAAVVHRSGRPILLPEMEPKFLSEISQGGEHLELMVRAGYRSAVVVPLIARGKTLGALSLVRFSGGTAYGEDDLILAEELAGRAALVVDNARLYEATRHLAATLQHSLLPASLPVIPHTRLTPRYRAAELGQEVGGDFYDAFAIERHAAWGLCIGDVCGKGAEAAALTAFARYTMRAFADCEPGAVLEHLNETVIRERRREEGNFLTTVFARVATHEGRLEFDLAAGGHPPPLIVRADGVVEPVIVGGPLIGLDPDARFVASRALLHPGEALLLYTDGLTDAQAPERILTELHLIEILSSTRALAGQERVGAIESVVGDSEPRDDIAMLLIENTAPAPRLAAAQRTATRPPLEVR